MRNFRVKIQDRMCGDVMLEVRQNVSVIGRNEVICGMWQKLRNEIVASMRDEIDEEIHASD